MGAAKGLNMDDFIPLRELGIQNLIGTTQRGLGVQFARATIAAGPVLALTFDGLGLTDMVNANYAIFAENHSTGVAVTVTAGTKTVAGFTLDAGPIATDVVNIVIVGQIEGHPNP